MHVSLDSNLGFENVHRIASHVEREVKHLIPHSRVMVRTGPLEYHRQNIGKLVKEMAEQVPGSRGVHNIHIQKISGKMCVDLHLEVSAHMTLKQAHQISDQVERRIRAANPNVREVTIHMESAQDRVAREMTGAGTEVKWHIEHLAKSFPEIKAAHGIRIRKVGGMLHVLLRCSFDPKISVKQADEVCTKLENVIKIAYPNIARIDVHEEPA
jgi:divalent metal cation (Fe/Co/Zn/Cd) transporter